MKIGSSLSMKIEPVLPFRARRRLPDGLLGFGQGIGAVAVSDLIFFKVALVGLVGSSAAWSQFNHSHVSDFTVDEFTFDQCANKVKAMMSCGSGIDALQVVTFLVGIDSQDVRVTVDQHLRNGRLVKHSPGPFLVASRITSDVGHPDIDAFALET